MNRTLIFSLQRVLCLGVLVLKTALPGSAVAQEMEPERTYVFRVFHHHRGLGEGLRYLETPDESASIAFHRNRRSRDHAYRGPPTLTFFTESGVDPATGEPIRNLQGQVILADNREPWLLFVFPALPGTDGLPLQIVATRDGESGFPNDHLRFFNATGAPLSGVFGDQPIALPRGAAVPIDLRPYYGASIPLGLGVEHEGAFKPVYVSKLRFDPGARRIFVLLPPRLTRSFRIEGLEIVDFPGLAERIAAENEGAAPDAPPADGG